MNNLLTYFTGRVEAIDRHCFRNFSVATTYWKRETYSDHLKYQQDCLQPICGTVFIV